MPPTLAQWPLCHLPAAPLIQAACLIVYSIGLLTNMMVIYHELGCF